MVSCRIGAASCYYYKALVVGVLLLLVGGAGAGVSCGAVSQQALAPCLGYLTKGTPEPTSSSSCCKGARDLHALANSQPAARQDICKCLEKFAAQVRPLTTSVSSLPAGICDVAFPYSFSPTQDCSKIA